MQTEASNAGEFALGLMEEMKREGVELDVITYGWESSRSEKDIVVLRRISVDVLLFLLPFRLVNHLPVVYRPAFI